jgi:nucleoid-associated protein YgaU
MGIISFLKTAGEHIFSNQHDDYKAQKAEEIVAHLKKLGLKPHSLVVEVEKDTAILKGQLDSEKERIQIITAVGNINGIGQVDNRLRIPGVNELDVKRQFYVVQAGDTLGMIADRFYGDPRATQRIYDANSHMMNHPEQIYPGQTLVIPIDHTPGQRAA